MAIDKKDQEKSLPRVALIGKPNVGKSSLFNRLTRSKAALVADTPGLTRDRRYAEADLGRCKITLVDTGGVALNIEDPLYESVGEQTKKAINEADVLVVIFDGPQGLSPDDIDILAMARRSRKPLIGVVNKIDSEQKTTVLSDFFETGLSTILGISVTTGRGIRGFKETLCALLAERAERGKGREYPGAIEGNSLEDVDRPRVCGEDNFPVRVSIIGRPNVGKSSLLNRILGQSRMLVSDIPGTTRDAIDCMVQRPGYRPLTFVDTAGIRRKSRVKDKIEKFSAIKSLDSIRHSHICLCIFDAVEGITDQDKRLVGYTAEYGKGCITVFNKWDAVKEDPKNRRLLNEEARTFRKIVPYAPHLNISALTGKNIDKLFALIHQVYHDYSFRVTTGRLNRLLRQALLRKNPPVTKGHYLKLFYMTQTGTRPPTLTFFANYPELFPDHYRRYLSNFFRKELNIRNTPVKIIFRAR